MTIITCDSYLAFVSTFKLPTFSKSDDFMYQQKLIT